MTNELIKVQTNQEGEQRVSARELYKCRQKAGFGAWRHKKYGKIKTF